MSAQPDPRPNAPNPQPDRGDAERGIIALISARGGGDKGRVLALAAALRDGGRVVHLLCDGDVGAAVASARLPAIWLPRALEQAGFYHPLHVPRMAARGERIEADTPDPLRPWAEACLSHALRAVAPLRPALLLSSLFCMPLAERLAGALAIPWVPVNPGCYFGDDARRPWEADYPGIVAGMFRHWLLPPMGRATAVLHATDPEFDPPPASLAPNHHYVGPLDLEQFGPDRAVPDFLAAPGDPWALVTLSTVPQMGEVALARAALAALAPRGVRVLLTLAPGHDRSELGPVPPNARVEGFVPHGPVLDRACLVVGHAGHGMVMKALGHGVPMVLVPWGRDQVAVAARAEAMGVAEVVPRSECGPDPLRRAVARVLDASDHAAAAQRASARLRSYNPLEQARGIVERLIREHVPSPGPG